jgi:hypothetical protein
MDQKKKNTVLGAAAVVIIALALVIAYINTRPPKVEEDPNAGQAEVEIRPNRATAPDFEMPEQPTEGGN